MSYQPLSTQENALSDMQGLQEHSSFARQSLQSPPLPHIPTMSGELQEKPWGPGSPELPRPRTVSRDGSGPMHNPTPDLQSLQGAYTGNIERLEESAERMSMSSDIGEEIRKLCDEQKLSDSRRSSLLRSRLDEEVQGTTPQRESSFGMKSRTSNSIIGLNNLARNGGYSPTAHHASPRGSLRSSSRSQQHSLKGRNASNGSRMARTTETTQDAEVMESPLSMTAPSAAQYLDGAFAGYIQPQHFKLSDNDGFLLQTDMPTADSTIQTEKRTSSASHAQRRDSLFSDFDGVHTISHTKKDSNANEHEAPQESVSPPRGVSASHTNKSRDEKMVFYPAPVPMMLNLPKRLSTMPSTGLRGNRSSQMISPPVLRVQKSTNTLLPVQDGDRDSRLPPNDTDDNVNGGSRVRSALPPQLRASMYFEHTSVGQDVKIRQGSAVATLDSILDASAYAPVCAFTDHPFAGQMGPEVYGSNSRQPVFRREATDPTGQQRRSSTLNLLRATASRSNLTEGGSKTKSLLGIGNYLEKIRNSVYEPASTTDDTQGLARNEDESITSEDDSGSANSEDHSVIHEAEDHVLEDQPSTLLAELHIRKAEQKSRNRTAATAFPNGMHATLLQLDAVAQIQKQTRQQKHTRLAWEDPDDHPQGMGNEDDEDVPLGMLYSEQQLKKFQEHENRTSGLLAQRQLEDDEPLRHRRARLRGEELPPLRPSDTAEPQDDHPEETLAERSRRLKATQINSKPRRVSADFASEVMSQLGSLNPADQSKPELQPQIQSESVNRGHGKDVIEPQKSLATDAADERHSQPPRTNTQYQGDEHRSSSQLPQRRSMADLLQHHPAIGPSRKVSNEVSYTPAGQSRTTNWARQVNQHAGLATSWKNNMLNGYAVTQAPPVPQAWPWTGHQNNMNPVPNSGYGYMAPHPMLTGNVPVGPPGTIGAPIGAEQEAQQRAMVDRWRQSVMY